MWIDEIIEEIHQIRQAYVKSFNHDLDAIFTDLRKKKKESGRKQGKRILAKAGY